MWASPGTRRPRRRRPTATCSTCATCGAWCVKHKWMLVSVAIVGLLAALLLSFVRTPLYLATTTLQVDKRAAQVVKFEQDDQSAMQDVDDRTRMGTQLELLQSRVLAERVIDELGLDRQGMLQAGADAQRAARRRARQRWLASREDDTGWLAMGENILDRDPGELHQAARAGGEQRRAAQPRRGRRGVPEVGQGAAAAQFVGAAGRCGEPEPAAGGAHRQHGGAVVHRAQPRAAHGIVVVRQDLSRDPARADQGAARGVGAQAAGLCALARTS